jgi:hypothetical protein
VRDAHKAVESLWDQYKVMATMLVSNSDADDSDDDDVELRDQYDEYYAEPRLSNKHMTRHDSPIPYWISKRAIWPQLVQMALDIYTTPACSDEPERMFTEFGIINQGNP